MMLYSVVNMDIVGSRRIAGREKLQNSLNSYIDQLNRKYSDILAAPITMTLGDEWQLILNKPSESYNLIHEFQQLLWKDNVELYAGIGIGELSTPIFDDVRKMDGPCFHAARDAIKIVKAADKLKSKYSISKQNRIFFLTHSVSDSGFEFDILEFYYNSKSGFDESAFQEIAAVAETGHLYSNHYILFNRLIFERTINLIIENNEILKSKMTDKQREVYVSYLKHGSYRKVIETTTRETIGGISQKLNSASFFTIQRNHQLVSTLLGIYCNMGV